MKAFEQYFHVVLCYAAEGGSNFQVCRWNPSVWPFKWKLLSSTVYNAVQGGSNFKSLDETLVCDHSNESYWAVLSCGTVYYAVQGGSNF